MSKLLASLLDTSLKDLSLATSKLESLSGYPSEDIRLATEINAKLRQKIADLGLDPDNTTGPELYHALRLRLLDDDNRFSRALGISGDSTNKTAEAIVSLVRHGLPHCDVLALKKTSAKNLLRLHPPSRLMKKLNYRSVDSMLKRENVAELFAGAAFTESKRWLDSFWSKHALLKQSDFEIRKIEFIIMPPERWAKAVPSSGLVSCMLQLGAAAVWPPVDSKRVSLKTAYLAFEAVEIMRFYSASLKADQFSASFGKRMLARMQQYLHSPVVVEGLPVTWSSLHRHYGRPGSPLPAALEGYLDSDELHHHRPQQLLASLNPSFAWWADTHHVASLADGRPVSLNLGDVLTATAGTQYHRRQHQNLKIALWDELLHKYLKYPGVESYIVSQLDSQAAGPETRNINFFNKQSTKFAGELELA